MKKFKFIVFFNSIIVVLILFLSFNLSFAIEPHTLIDSPTSISNENYENLNYVSSDDDCNGGVFIVKSDLILDYIGFYNNSVETSESTTYEEIHACGGAIYNYIDGTITISSSVFSKNFVSGYCDKYSYGYGGAIYNAGTITISSSVFTENIAGRNTVSSISPIIVLGGGGAIYNYINGIVTISSSVFTGNIAGGKIVSSNSPRVDGYGGAIYNTGTMIISSSVFTENSAIHSGYDAKTYGGAIYNTGTITISSSVFSKNSISSAPQLRGGAIYNTNGSSISNNMTIISSVFSENSAYYSRYAYGGAICNCLYDISSPIGEVIISSSVFSKNSANSNDDQGKGGAIYNSKIISTIKGTTTINSSFFNENSASEYGGAICNDLGTMIISSSVFSKNSASNERRAVYGGAIYNTGTMIISSSVFSENSAIVSNNSGNRYMYAYGGAIDNSGAITIISSVFIENSAAVLGYNYSTIQLHGGAIFNNGVINLIAKTNNVEFTGNKANGISNAIHDNGGTINLWASEDADIIFNDRITSSNNSSILNINSSTTTLTANGKIILNEDMSGYTGNVNLYGGEIELQAKTNGNNINTNKFFSGNIYLSSGTLNILNSAIDNVTVRYLTTTSNTNLKFDVDLSNNTSDNFTITNSEMGILNLTAINILGINEDSGQITLFNNSKSPTLNILTTANYGGYEYTFTNSNIIGVLNYEKTGLVIKTLKNYVNTTELEVRSYSLVNSEIVTESLGELGGTQLTIFGNNKNIEGNNVNGIFVAKDKTLIIEDVSNWSGFNGMYGAIKNEGILNISGTNFSDNAEQDIINNGNLTLSGNTSSFEKGIVGIGTTTISGANINLANAIIEQNKIEINDNGSLTANASNMTADIENNSNLTFTQGTNSNYIFGNGTTTIDGDVINSSTIINNIKIKENRQLATNASDITGNINNEGKYILTNGENKNQIYGIGATIIAGEVINSSKIATNLMINEEKQLTTSATNIERQIENNGNLIFNGGESKNRVFGNGTTTIDGDVINNSSIVNSIVINETKKLTTNANNIIGNVTNNGSIEFIDGIITSSIIGDNGTVIISSNIVNNSTINQKVIEINNELINNSSITAKNIYINGTFKGNFFNATNTIISGDSNIYLDDNKIQNYNFENLTITSGNLSLIIDADLQNETMDTISANDNSQINGTINVKAINILSDSKEKETEVLFTNSEILKDKITSTTTAYSQLYKYDVFYNDGYFNFINTNVNPEINPIIFESAIAGMASGLITQVTVLNQAFSSIDSIRNRMTSAKEKGFLYASTADVVFNNGGIESGLWIRPFMAQDTISIDNLDVDNTLMGTLAGLDLAVGETSLVSFYLGYAGSNQKYEDIKVNQTGYIVGATGMIIKDNWYAGLTANINFNKAESQSDYGTDSFDLNMYSVGAKTGYNLELNEKWTLEPNLMLMYGSISNQEYETTQGAKVDSQSNSNIIIEPQVKAKLSLENGWQPYGLLGYVANISDKAKVVADETEFEADKINGYVEYGAGVNKDFINTPWSCYVQITGRSGGRNGFSGNLGIKYSF